jgi:hypothetical protein
MEGSVFAGQLRRDATKNTPSEALKILCKISCGAVSVAYNTPPYRPGAGVL